MKVFKYKESNLVKLKEDEQKNSKIIAGKDVESFLASKSKFISKFILPNKLDRGDIYYALLPLRRDGGQSCKAHPVMVIEDFGLNYDLFAKREEIKKSETKSQGKEDVNNKKEDSVLKENNTSLQKEEDNNDEKNNPKSEKKPDEKKEYKYSIEKFNFYFPRGTSIDFFNLFSKGKEPMVLVYVLTTTLIDSLCLGLDAQYKPIAPTSKFPLPFFKKDNLKKFGYIELFKDVETVNGITTAFAPLLIPKRIIFSNAGPDGSKARLQSTDRLLFSRMIINKDDWEKERLDDVLKGRIEPVGKCLIEPMDFDNSGFKYDSSYQKETVTYVRDPLRIMKGEPEEVTVTIPIIKDLQRSIIFAKYRKIMLGEKDLFPCWPDNLWGELKESKVYDKEGNPVISSTNPIVEKSRYLRIVKFDKPKEEIFNDYKKQHYIPSNKKYEELSDKKIEFIYDRQTRVNGKPKLIHSRVYSAEEGRECIFEGKEPNIYPWLPESWDEEAKKELERKEEEERKRKEEEEKKSKKNEIKRDSNGKVIINLSNRAHSSDKAQSPKKKVTVKVRNSPSDEEATSPQVNPSNEEPKDTVIDTDTENEEINEVNESKEYSFSELKDFLESF